MVNIMFSLSYDCIRSPSRWLHAQFSKESDCLCPNLSDCKVCTQLPQATGICLQAEAPRNSICRVHDLILNQQQGNFGCNSQSESMSSVEAHCQYVIHLNTVKLKAVYCSPRPFILLNVSLLLANLSVRASTCQVKEGKSWGYRRRVFLASLQSACS